MLTTRLQCKGLRIAGSFYRSRLPASLFVFLNQIMFEWLNSRGNQITITRWQTKSLCFTVWPSTRGEIFAISDKFADELVSLGMRTRWADCETAVGLGTADLRGIRQCPLRTAFLISRPIAVVFTFYVT